MSIIRRLLNAFFPSPVWENPRPMSFAEEKCSLLHVEEDGATVTKTGTRAYVIELYGKDYSGLDNETITNLFYGRKSLFDNLPPEISIFVQSHRVQEKVAIDFDLFSNNIARKVAERYYEGFSKTYRTRHFLIVTNSQTSTTETFTKALEKAAGTQHTDTLTLLRNTTQKIVHKLEKTYGAALLNGDALASYWGWLLTGKPVFQKLPESGDLDNILCRSTLKFPDKENYMIYGQADRDVYSAWFIIKHPPNTLDQKVMNTLFQVQERFSVYQTYTPHSKNKAMSRLQKREDNVQSHMKANDLHIEEITALKGELQADLATKHYIRFALEIFGQNLEDLEKAINEVEKALVDNGFGLARETTNREGCFWMRFPSMENCNAREKETTSKSAAYFTTFANVGEGFSNCSWGKAPVHIKTLSGSVFSYTWHHSPAEKALGNTLVIGGSEVGKTTLITFLLDKCFVYNDFKVVAFDRLRGMESWTTCMGGDYITNTQFVRGIGLNPLQIDDHFMLLNFVNRLTGPLDENQKDSIGKGIRQIMDLSDIRKKNLTELHPAILGCGSYGEQAARQLEKWLPGNDYGHYFNADYDALDFSDSKQLVTFDMTKILDSAEVVGPLAYYIFYKIFQAAQGGSGFAVVIDELPKYLRNKDFKDHIPTLLQEIRKLDGIFISMVQSADHILRHEAAQAYLNNTATFLLFPEPRAAREDYIDTLGLNEAEFKWIKTTDVKSRQVLLKRRGGESVLLDVDLSALGNLLRIYDSSADAVQNLRHFRGEYGEDFLSHYLA